MVTHHSFIASTIFHFYQFQRSSTTLVLNLLPPKKAKRTTRQLQKLAQVYLLFWLKFNCVCNRGRKVKRNLILSLPPQCSINRLADCIAVFSFCVFCANVTQGSINSKLSFTSSASYRPIYL